MFVIRKIIVLLLISFVILPMAIGQKNSRLLNDSKSAMLKATRFMMEKVSTNGGFVWYYTPDMSRRWGEMEATRTMIWLQDPGTTLVGHTLLDAYNATGEEYYYQAACKVANAIIYGQSAEGGWNYLVDFAGDRALQQWYATIGKNGWRLEEYQHYYGNSTFDDNVTSDAARYLLRMYMTKLAPEYKPSLDKAIGFVLKSQYPNGGWPQRYPLMGGFCKNGHPDYTSYYTYNDDVIKENVRFLIQCYLALGEQRFLDPIRRGMDFYLLSQDSCGGWGQQMDLEMHTAGARTYEPAALLPKNTAAIIDQLLDFYTYTGDVKYLQPIPAALKWLERTKLPQELTENGRYTHPQFLEAGTNKALYPHRKGSNVIYGSYYVDGNCQNLLAHYGGRTFVDIKSLEERYRQTLQLSPEEATKNSPFKADVRPGYNDVMPDFYQFGKHYMLRQPDNAMVSELIKSLDKEGRWLVKHAMISNPYKGDGTKTEPTDAYANTFVGDDTDTSPYRDTSDALYISTGAYVRNMQVLIHFVTIK